MDRERRNTDVKKLPRSQTSNLKENPGSITEPVKKLKHQENICNGFRPREHKHFKSCNNREETKCTALDYTQESEDVSRHQLSSDTATGIRQQKPDTFVASPSKKFKRPKSYIRGRKDNSENQCCSAQKGKERESTMKREFQTGELEQSERLADRFAQEKCVQAALNKINYLNKKLKARESTKDYLKSLSEDNSSCGIDLDPEPPIWSYESYSESERQGASLPGLRSYIRTQESRLDDSVSVRDAGVSLCHSPQQSLVGYLDGVLSTRLPLKRCSMSLQPNFDDNRVTGGGQSPRKERTRTRQSSRTFKDNSQRRSSSSLDRTGSKERVKQPAVSKYEEKSKGNGSEECYEKIRGFNLESSDGEECFFQQSSPQRTKTTPVFSRRSQPEPTVDQARQKTKELSCNSKHPKKKSWNFENPLENKEGKLSPQKPSTIGGSKESFKVKTEESRSSSHNLAIEHMSETPRTLILSPQKGTNRSQSVGRLLVHSGHAMLPIVHAQDVPLTLDDGFWMANDDGEDPVQIFHEVVGSENTHEGPKDRLILQKDNSLSGMWNSGKTQQEADDKSDCRQFSCDWDEDDMPEEDDEEQDEKEVECEEDDGNDEEYEDLVIQTELSAGSKVIVSNKNGPIADIEHGNVACSDSFQSTVAGRNFVQNSGEVAKLNDILASKPRNKSKNNVENDKSTTCSISSSCNDKTLNPVMKNSSVKGLNKSAVEIPSQVHNTQHSIASDSSKPRWASVTRSPPKSSVVPSPKIRQDKSSKSGKEKCKEKPIRNQEIAIPLSSDGMTRVLLVLRTPPKKAKDPDRAKINLEKNKKSASPFKPLSKISISQAPRRINNSTKIEQPELIMPATSKSGQSLEALEKVEDLNTKQRSNESPKTMHSARAHTYSSSLQSSNKSVANSTKVEKRRNLHTFDSMMPKHRMQHGDREESTRNQNENMDDGDGDGDSTINDYSPVSEAVIQARGPCKFSMYHPCRHDLNPPVNAIMITKPKPQAKKEFKTKVTPDQKMNGLDHDPCSFEIQPISHVTHTPCQFDQFRPCVHKECEAPVSEASLLDLQECSSEIKHGKTVKPNNFIFSSKAVNFGTHSPCLYTKYKPCLHEELVGPLTSLDDTAGVSLLSSASRYPRKLDTKTKKKESIPVSEQCKFDRYTPCFHEVDIKFHKALGRNVTLRPEKSKDQSAIKTKEIVSNICKFDPYKPCFCQEKMGAMKTSPSELLDNTEEKLLAQHEQTFNLKTASKKLTKPNKTFSNFETSNEFAGTYKSTYSKDHKEKGTAAKLACTESARAPADGPELNVKTVEPKINAALCAGEKEIIKPDNAAGMAGDGAAQPGALSLMGRITRTWFCSAQAQVARLTPPSRTMVVTPALRSDNGLGTDFQANAREDCATNKAAPAALDSSKETYSRLQRPPSKSPRKHEKASGNNHFLSDTRRGSQAKHKIIKCSAGKDYSFNRPVYHEMSLGETGKMFEACETDFSQESEIPDVTLTTMTYNRALSTSSESYCLARADRGRTSFTETCGGHPESGVRLPITRQLWTGGDGVPEDFLVLTFNTFPLRQEEGYLRGTASNRTRVLADKEVLSADPLPVHFSDQAKTKRGVGGNRRQMLKNNQEKLHASQAGLILCHSSRNQHHRHWTNDVRYSSPPSRKLSPQKLAREGFVHDQFLTQHRIGEDVETFFPSDSATKSDGDTKLDGDTRNVSHEEVSSGKAEEKSIPAHQSPNGDTNTDPSYRHLKRNNKHSYPLCKKRKSSPQTTRKLSFQAQRHRHRNAIILEQVTNPEPNKVDEKSDPEILAGKESDPDILVGKESDPEILASKESEAVVVASATLSSYQCLLSTLKKMAREDASNASPIDQERDSSSLKFPRCRRTRFTSSEDKHESIETDSLNRVDSITNNVKEDPKAESIEKEEQEADSDIDSSGGIGPTVIEEDSTSGTRQALPNTELNDYIHKESKPILNQDKIQQTSSNKSQEKDVNEGEKRASVKERGGCLSFRVSGLPKKLYGDSGNIPKVSVVASKNFDLLFGKITPERCVEASFQNFPKLLEDAYNKDCSLHDQAEGFIASGSGGSESRAFSWDDNDVWIRKMLEMEKTDDEEDEDDDEDSIEESSCGEEDSEEIPDDKGVESSQEEYSDETEDEDDDESLISEV